MLWIVWSVWALMLSAGIIFVWRFGSNVPYWDEWNLAAVLAGEQPVTIDWLWSPHNGHRIPVPRLVLLALLNITGHDFRAGMYFNVLVLGALAAAMMLMARWQRGRTSWTDAFFPLVLLQWGHFENLLWTWQLSQVLPVILASILLLIVVRHGAQLSLSVAVLAGICLTLLPLCGLPGLVYVPPMSVWLIWCGITHWWSALPGQRWKSFVIWGLTLMALLLTALYFVNYHGQGPPLNRLSVSKSIETAMQFVAGSFGPAAERTWPVSGACVLAFAASTSGLLLYLLWRGGTMEGGRALGLLLFLAGLVALAGSIGLGRPGYGFTSRYSLQVVPGLCLAYFAWAIYSRRAARLIQAILLIAIVLSLPTGVQEGLRYGRVIHGRLEAFRRDLLGGKPISALVARHVSSVCPYPHHDEPLWGNVLQFAPDPFGPSKFPQAEGVAYHDWLVYWMETLHRGEVAYFSQLQPERRRFVELPLSLSPDPRVMTVARQTNAGEPSEVNLTYTLTGPRFIYGIRISRRPDAAIASRTRMQVFRRDLAVGAFTQLGRYIHFWIEGEDVETFWIYDTTDRFTILLDGDPEILQKFDVVLLVPENDPLPTSGSAR
jgi:hypothetical protein